VADSVGSDGSPRRAEIQKPRYRPLSGARSTTVPALRDSTKNWTGFVMPSHRLGIWQMKALSVRRTSRRVPMVPPVQPVISQ
jgi:hypothetical protein